MSHIWCVCVYVWKRFLSPFSCINHLFRLPTHSASSHIHTLSLSHTHPLSLFLLLSDIKTVFEGHLQHQSFTIDKRIALPLKHSFDIAYKFFQLKKSKNREEVRRT